MDTIRTGRAAPGRSRVLVADAYAASRAGIRAAVRPHDVVAEAADARGAVHAAANEEPDVCVVALELPGGGVPAIRAILHSAPERQIVALAEDLADEDAVAALAAGAVALVTRAQALERLPDILAAPLDGYALIPATLLARVAERAERERRNALWRDRPRAAFSPRERQVLEALRDGASTADIALELGLSAVTVRRYVSGVLRKAGVPDREALAQMLAARD
jgi:two-component system, NarL family, nitrate/nitrite response regulator NarL